jgi:hypothetical protein
VVGCDGLMGWWVPIYTRSTILPMIDDFDSGVDLILRKRSPVARPSAHAHAADRHRLANTSDLRRGEVVYRQTQRVYSRGVALVLLDDTAELLSAADLPHRDDAESLVEHPVPSSLQYSSGSRIVVTDRSHSVMIQKRLPLCAV